MCVWINVEFGKAEGAVNANYQRVLNIIFMSNHFSCSLKACAPRQTNRRS